MDAKIKDLLSSIGIYSKSYKDWKYVSIEHTKPESDSILRELRKKLKDQIGEIGGVYVYENEKGVLLYVGESKLIYSRLAKHYTHCYKPMPSYSKSPHFYDFWSKNRGKMKIYYYELDDKEKRELLELILQNAYKPKFLGKKSMVK